MNKQLWQPGQTQLADANITAFIEWVNQRFDPGIKSYASLHQWSVEHSEDFWSAVWDFCEIKASSKGKKVLVDGHKMPGAQWFPDARLNFAENLLWRDDQHTALIAACEDGRISRISYAELNEHVARLAAWLKDQGVRVGDRVAGYLPNLPETIIAALAAIRIGAVWSSCSPDFGVNAVCDRFGQIKPVILIAASAYRYNGKTFDCRANIKAIIERVDSIKQTVVVSHVVLDDTLATLPLESTSAWADVLSAAADLDIPDYVQLPFNHPLYILFSSGTTGAPKCIVHGAGGTLLQHAKEHRLHVNLTSDDNLFYFTTCGWMMWNWLVSGLATGCTLTLFDGSPFHPKAHKLFRLAAELGITVLGTSAKMISAWEKLELRPGDRFDLSRLRTILSTGSPLLPNSFDYVYNDIKSDICLSSISGGTDIVSCFALGNPVLPVYRGELQCVGLGMDVKVRDDDGNVLPEGTGELCCDQPFPSMPVGFWNDADGSRYHAAYFDKYAGIWSHGDYARLVPHVDARAGIYNSVIIFGRSDATLNPGGVRIGTAEIYRQVDSLDIVKESVCIGQDWDDDQRVILFVVLQRGIELDDRLEADIRQVIRANTSPRHVPARIIAVDDIPRTISGKISELAVRDVVHGRTVKNTGALANPEALDYFADLPELAS